MTEWPPVHQLGDASGQTTRDRIIDAALYLFWLRGYAATGIAEILERAEANAGSFYHFFKAKKGLPLAVLDLYARSLMPVVVAPCARRNRRPD